MIYDVVPPSVAARRYHLRRLIENLPSRGIVQGETAVLLVYNRMAPELSYILTEHI